MTRRREPVRLARPDYAPTGVPLSIMGSYVIGAPPIVEHDGHPVTWTDWSEGLRMTHIDPTCEHCQHPEPALTAHGLMPYTETSADAAHDRVQHVKAHRPFVRRRGERRTWQARRLFAFLCPLCLALEVYDHGPHGRDWIVLDAAQPSLFDVPGGP